MKINVIIADDEYFIRQRIKKIIPWEKLGLTFCGEAENGKQVLDLLENKPADILLLDIKMPQMDGIETARYITEHFPHIHMIILSGYNDFEYARSMLRYGGKEYGKYGVPRSQKPKGKRRRRRSRKAERRIS